MCPKPFFYLRLPFMRSEHFWFQCLTYNRGRLFVLTECRDQLRLPFRCHRVDEYTDRRIIFCLDALVDRMKRHLLSDLGNQLILDPAEVILQAMGGEGGEEERRRKRRRRSKMPSEGDQHFGACTVLRTTTVGYRRLGCQGGL